MTDIIILIGIVLLSLIGLKAVISHTKGEGTGCCNTSDKPLVIKKNYRGKIVNKILFEIRGMNCEHCRIKVQNEINNIQGIVGFVDLKKGQAMLECEREIDPDLIIECVEKIGYQAIYLSTKN